MTDPTNANPGALRDALDEAETLRQELTEARAEVATMRTLTADNARVVAHLTAERDALVANLAVLAQDRDERTALAERIVIGEARVLVADWKANRSTHGGPLTAAVEALDGT